MEAVNKEGMAGTEVFIASIPVNQVRLIPGLVLLLQNKLSHQDTPRSLIFIKDRGYFLWLMLI